MEIKPIRRCSEPSYPTRPAVDQHPDILRLVPKRWHNNPAVAAALGALYMMTLSVRSNTDPKATKSPTAKIAPIFVHGEGRGSFGCVSVAPPVFLSEDEARQVICDEAKHYGINFEKDAPTLTDIDVPLPKVNEEPPKWARVNNSARMPLALDGIDKTRKISYEFISEEDLRAWKCVNQESTAGTYDFIGTARTLDDSLIKAHPDFVCAVFYDPSPDKFPVHERTTWDELIAAGKEAAREQLRKQVHSFIVWLSAEGII